MKHYAMEARMQRARQYHRSHAAHFEEGMIVRYDYRNIREDDLTFWDDAVFIVNGYRVALWWVHPRYAYKNLISEAASQRMEHISPFKGDATPTTGQRRGSRRRWLRSGGLFGLPPEITQAYFDHLRLAERQISEEVPFFVKPSLKVQWTDWCRGMNLCAPFEVRCEADLKRLVEIARRLVKRETTLDDEFGHHQYTQQDWLRESAFLNAKAQIQN